MTKKQIPICKACGSQFEKLWKRAIYCCEFCSIAERLKRQGDCLVWTGAKNDQGYGQVTINRSRKYVHRISYEAHERTLLPGEVLCHRCDTPLCCNPEHLFPGSQRDNMRDMAEKGRAVTVLTPEEVAEIFRLKGILSQNKIAKAFSTSSGNVCHIHRGSSWNHITGLPLMPTRLRKPRGPRRRTLQGLNG